METILKDSQTIHKTLVVFDNGLRKTIESDTVNGMWIKVLRLALETKSTINQIVNYQLKGELP